MATKPKKTDLKQSAARAQSGAWQTCLFWLNGIAADYWKDGAWPVFVPKVKNKGAEPSKTTKSVAEKQINFATISQNAEGRWYIDPVCMVEAMWGKGHALPGGDKMFNTLIASAGLANNTNVLNLTAGFGALERLIIKKYNYNTLTGLEPNTHNVAYADRLNVQAGVSKRIHIEHYDPSRFFSKPKYELVIARELFYRLPYKENFFAAIRHSMKPQGQIVFTDYLITENAETDPIITQWLEAEGGATPLTLAEMTQAWVRIGFDVRVNEDLTEEFRRSIMVGLANLAAFLKTHPPDEVTKKLVAQELEIWALRASALAKGAKFSRFCAICTDAG